MHSGITAKVISLWVLWLVVPLLISSAVSFLIFFHMLQQSLALWFLSPISAFPVFGVFFALFLNPYFILLFTFLRELILPFLLFFQPTFHFPQECLFSFHQFLLIVLSFHTQFSLITQPETSLQTNHNLLFQLDHILWFSRLEFFRALKFTWSVLLFMLALRHLLLFFSIKPR